MYTPVTCLALIWIFLARHGQVPKETDEVSTTILRKLHEVFEFCTSYPDSVMNRSSDFEFDKLSNATFLLFSSIVRKYHQSIQLYAISFICAKCCGGWQAYTLLGPTNHTFKGPNRYTPDVWLEWRRQYAWLRANLVTSSDSDDDFVTIGKLSRIFQGNLLCPNQKIQQCRRNVAWKWTNRLSSFLQQ